MIVVCVCIFIKLRIIINHVIRALHPIKSHSMPTALILPRGIEGSMILVTVMYVCMVITHSRAWINRLRLPILLVVN